MPPGEPNVPASNTSGSWARRLDTRRDWRAFREYYETYLPAAMPPSAPPSVCTGPIAYKGQDLLRRDIGNCKAALQAVGVQDAFLPAVAPGTARRPQNQYYPTEQAYRI